MNWSKRDKVWKTLVRFKSDVFTAVAVVDAKTPYLKKPAVAVRSTGHTRIFSGNGIQESQGSEEGTVRELRQARKQMEVLLSSI